VGLSVSSTETFEPTAREGSSISAQTADCCVETFRGGHRLGKFPLTRRDDSLRESAATSPPTKGAGGGWLESVFCY
jgi:hypothetical protein